MKILIQDEIYFHVSNSKYYFAKFLVPHLSPIPRSSSLLQEMLTQTQPFRLKTQVHHEKGKKLPPLCLRLHPPLLFEWKVKHIKNYRD